MTTTDEILREGTEKQICDMLLRAGIVVERDVLAATAASSAFLVRVNEHLWEELAGWLDNVVPLLRAVPLPKAPGDADMLADSYRLAATAARDCLEVVERLQRDLVYGFLMGRPTGKRPRDWDDLAFAITAEWLWRHAKRRDLTGKTLALLARATSVETRDVTLSRPSPTRHWKHALTEARSILDAHGDNLPLTPVTLGIHLLRTQLGGTADEVVAILLAPEYLENLRRRHEGVAKPDK